MTQDIDILWKRIQNNSDELALEQVYRAAFIPLVKYANHITGSFHTAEEVVQDVFLKIWQNRSALIIKGSFKSYLFKTVHNQALNLIRHQKTTKESVNLVASEKLWQFISDTHDSNDNLIERIFSDETEDLIEKTIKELPEQCRNVFIMSRLGALKDDVIAAKLGVSKNTVKTHIYKALKRIAEVLKKEN